MKQNSITDGSAISLVTNISVVTPVPSGKDNTGDQRHDEASMSSGKASHAEVLATSKSAATKMKDLILCVLGTL